MLRKGPESQADRSITRIPSKCFFIDGSFGFPGLVSLEGAI
jgi:hypothetical protein